MRKFSCSRCRKIKSFTKGVFCKECVEWYGQRRDSRLRKGLCTRCGIRPFEKGKFNCFLCLIKNAIAHLPEPAKSQAKIALKYFDKKCGVCKSPTTGSKRSWHLDHDHKTKRFRGFLCHHCNLTLGQAQDSIERLEQLIKYLRRAEQ